MPVISNVAIASLPFFQPAVTVTIAALSKVLAGNGPERTKPAISGVMLPRGIPRVAVEAGVTDVWRKYVGLEGAVVGIDRYGESAPAGDLFKHFGFTAENVAKTVSEII